MVAKEELKIKAKGAKPLPKKWQCTCKKVIHDDKCPRSSVSMKTALAALKVKRQGLNLRLKAAGIAQEHRTQIVQHIFG